MIDLRAENQTSSNVRAIGLALASLPRDSRKEWQPVEFCRFPEMSLELVVPNAYSVNPISGGNWEDSGVVPDIAVPADQALVVAHEKALESLIENWRRKHVEIRSHAAWDTDLPHLGHQRQR